MNTLAKPQISAFGHSTGIIQMEHTFVFVKLFPIKKKKNQNFFREENKAERHLHN